MEKKENNLKNTSNLQQIYESIKSRESVGLTITREESEAIQEALIAYIYRVRDTGMTIQKICTLFYPVIRSRNVVVKIQRRDWWPLNNHAVLKILEKLLEVDKNVPHQK